MRSKVFINSGALICLFGALTLAQNTRQRIQCGRINSPGEAGICAYFAYKKAVAEMDKVYRQLSSQLSGAGGKTRGKLRRAQSIWRRYRETTCESEASHVAGGPLDSLVYNSCLASVTKERTERLKAYLTMMQNPKVHRGFIPQRRRDMKLRPRHLPVGRQLGGRGARPAEVRCAGARQKALEGPVRNLLGSDSSWR